MKIQQEFSSEVLKQAYINEVKGILFEFLVAQYLAQAFKREFSFLQSLPLNYLEQLNLYQAFLREHDGPLFTSLPGMAKAQSTLLQQFLEKKAINSITEVWLVGKVNQGEVNKEWKESDIMLKNDNFLIPISLKLSKKNAFVNTKSAGAQSFLEKYFSEFSQVGLVQKALNLQMQDEFKLMAQALHESKGLRFSGSFDAWEKANLATLPGELEEPLRNIVFDYYNQVTNLIEIELRKFYQQDSFLFLRSLFPLCGLGHHEMIQAIYFHDTKHPASLIWNYEEFLAKAKNYQFPSLKGERTEKSFEIVFPEFKLQIRPKPMNKFTQGALKINCSIKYDQSLLQKSH